MEMLTTPWDVLGFCRSSVLNRVRALVDAVVAEKQQKKGGCGRGGGQALLADESLLPNLNTLMAQLAGASGYLWDAKGAKEVKGCVCALCGWGLWEGGRGGVVRGGEWEFGWSIVWSSVYVPLVHDPLLPCLALSLELIALPSPPNPKQNTSG
jgi:hypothetical protein